MKFLGIIAVSLGIWYFFQVYVLPRLGFNT